MTKHDKRHEIPNNIMAEVSKVVIGKDEIKQLLVVALLSQGHVLIEGLPGTAKTTIGRTFARAIDGKFKRIQGTPDMLPADILGFYLYHPDGSTTLMPGPIFANVLLADELNRTTPRTQAALLEAMQEQQVTIERETHPLEKPFIVIASQIPYGSHGTSPLTEVQSDRFMFRIWSALPDKQEEDRLLQDIDIISEPHISTVATPSDIIQLQQEVKKVYITDSIRRYIIDFLDKLRHHQDLLLGPSPRAGIALFKGSRALAFLQGRDFVIPDDVKRLLLPTLSHRIRMNTEAEMENITPEAIINEIATEVPVPKGEPTGQTEEVELIAKAATEALATDPDETASRTEEAANVTKEVRQETDTPVNSTSPEETPGKAEVAPARTQWLLPKILPEWEWILIIVALVIAVVMISFGLLSFR